MVRQPEKRETAPRRSVSGLRQPPVGSTRALTAAVTRSTQISGRASSISGIKVGDTVSAQITQHGGRPVATAIQDPVSVPGGLP